MGFRPRPLTRKIDRLKRWCGYIFPSTLPLNQSQQALVRTLKGILLILVGRSPSCYILLILFIISLNQDILGSYSGGQEAKKERTERVNGVRKEMSYDYQPNTEQGAFFNQKTREGIRRLVCSSILDFPTYMERVSTFSMKKTGVWATCQSFSGLPSMQSKCTSFSKRKQC